ncbi:hypothetical protein E4T52_09894 [Aureobasidium sp. EXF-3400]|nr:hypothetical protein E4T51_08985 [Aureobasidium sp. EXF-12344]KAI4775152.1 hypothetical protein E4T52_09894 [Aureobasidium sp. EXF-3400]
MADLNISKDHDITDSSNVPQSSPWTSQSSMYRHRSLTLLPWQGTEASPSEDLATVVDDLLSQLSTKFTNISSDLLTKMDEMSRRLDNLEASIQASARSQNEESK